LPFQLKQLITNTGAY